MNHWKIGWRLAWGWVVAITAMWWPGAALKAEDSIALAIRALQDPEPQIRLAALELLQEQWQSVRAELQAELRAGRKERIEPLLEQQQTLLRQTDRIAELAWRDPDQRVRQQALELLAWLQPDLKNPKILAAWKALLESPDSALAAARAWRTWFQAGISDLTNPRLETQYSFQAGRKLASDLALLADTLHLALTHSQVQVRAETLTTLDEAISALAQRLSGLQSVLGVPEYHPLVMAMADDILKVVRRLQGSVRDCLGLPHASVRQPACRLLESLAGLVQVWREEALQPQGGAVADQLQRELATSIPDLLSIATSDPNREVRLQALSAVEMIEPLSSRTWPALLEALRDPYVPARWTAARCLEASRSEAISEAERATIVRNLVRRLIEESEVGVRQRLAHSLQTWRTDLMAARAELAEALLQATGDWPGVDFGPFAPAHRQTQRQVRDQDVLLALLQALREFAQHHRMTSQEPLPSEWLPGLTAALDAEKPAVRVEACSVLALYGAQAFSARPALMRLLRDPDPQVRSAAASAVLRVTPAPQ